MEDRPRFQTGPREIRPSGIIGGPRETWPGWNCAPTSHTERARMVTLHLYTGAPELYPNNPCPKLGRFGRNQYRRKTNNYAANNSEPTDAHDKHESDAESAVCHENVTQIAENGGKSTTNNNE